MTKLLLTLALVATAARADLFEQLPALHGLDEKAILADIAAGGSFFFESDNFDFEAYTFGPDFIVTDSVRVWTYLPFVAAAQPYYPTLIQIQPGQKYSLNFFFTDGPQSVTLPTLSFSDASGDPIPLDAIGITSASGFLYGGRATVPEPSSLWLLALALALGARRAVFLGKISP